MGKTSRVGMSHLNPQVQEQVVPMTTKASKAYASRSYRSPYARGRVVSGDRRSANRAFRARELR